MAGRIAIFGAGNVGCFVGGTLALAGHDVTFIGRRRLRDEIRANGLTLLDRGRLLGTVPTPRFELDPAALEPAEIVFVTVKLGSLTPAAADLEAFTKPDALLVTLENGIGVAERLRNLIPDREVVDGTVAFNVVPLGNGRWEQASYGRVHAQRHQRLERLGLSLVDDMRPIEWGKLLVNLINAVNALSGLSLKGTFSHAGYRRVVAASLREALAALKAAGITPAKVGPTHPSISAIALGLPDGLFNNFIIPRLGMSENARLSMGVDYDAGRPTEVDELNGRISDLGRTHGIPTPVNDGLVRLVHKGGRHWPAAALEHELGLA